MRCAFIAGIFLLIWSLLTAVLYDNWKTKERQHLAKSTTVLETTYLAGIKMYQLATEILFEEVLQRPEVIDTFARGVSSEGEDQARERGRLYRLLSPAYAHLKEKGIRQLHFHTAAGKSYLRFHAPEKYGDPLADIRATVRIANTEKRPVANFEAGRLASGFRYIYPVFQGEKHLGSVETSVPFNAIRQAMSGIDPTHDYAMVLHQDAVVSILFPEQRPLYEKAPMHAGFLVEDPHLSLPDTPPPPAEIIRRINDRLRQEPQVQRGMLAGHTFSVPIFLETETWVVSFVPVKNILGRNEAYILSYGQAPLVAQLRREFFLNLALGTLTLAGFTWFTRRLVCSRKQLQEEKNHLLTVTDTIVDGLYVMDDQGHIIQINPAFSKILGYHPEEILGRIGHDIFHVHGGGSTSVPLAQCPIFTSTLAGKVYIGEELFRHKNGELVSVEVSCQPIIKDGIPTGSVTAFRDIGERKAADERIRYLAQYDTLTSLPNRTLLHDRLQQVINSRARNQEGFCVFFLDLDHFKTINDSLGHHIGDLLLQEVAMRLTACVRAEDTVCRHGGDEFIVVLRQIKNPAAAAALAQKVLNAIIRPYQLDGFELHITASIGIVLYPEDGQDKGTLIKHADSAMYHAKKSGRNNFQFFTEELNTRALERLSLENDLRRALERNEFLLHYQPQVDLATGAIVGTEALIRWQHPEQGLVPPNSFIPIAEDCGLIIPIGEWVLREVCRQSRSWREAGLPQLSVAINISALQFRQKNLEETIRRIIDETGARAECLDIELTESILMQDANSAVATLQRLKEMGLKISIDDFGTGYSSLSYLKTFPIHRLKIDRSFVRDVSSDPNDAAIASAIIAMGHRLQLKVVAEGVETAEQLRFLRQEGCDKAQGFYFSRPLPAAEMEALLRQNLPLPI